MTVTTYNKTVMEAATQRQLEAKALIRMAYLLNAAMAANDRQALFDAVTLNNRLWLFFYSQIDSKEVVLPPEVEQNIIALVAYVAKSAPRAFAADVSTINSLVSINRNIAAGLSEALGDAAAPDLGVVGGAGGSVAVSA